MEMVQSTFCCWPVVVIVTEEGVMEPAVEVETKTVIGIKSRMAPARFDNGF
jgi:hypothetical protein